MIPLMCSKIATSGLVSAHRLGDGLGEHDVICRSRTHPNTAQQGQSSHKMLFGGVPRPVILDSTNLGGMLSKEVTWCKKS